MHPDTVIVHKKYGHTVYLGYQTYQTPSIANSVEFKGRPQGPDSWPRFMQYFPLMDIQVYNYIYVCGISIRVSVVIAVSPTQHIYITYLPCQLTNASDVIGIFSFVLVTVSNLNLLIVSDLIWLTVFD